MNSISRAICCCGFLAFAALALADGAGWGWAVLAFIQPMLLAE